MPLDTLPPKSFEPLLDEGLEIHDAIELIYPAAYHVTAAANHGGHEQHPSLPLIVISSFDPPHLRLRILFQLRPIRKCL